VKNKVSRYERARIEKKVNNIQKNKGYTNLKNFTNLEELLKEKEFQSFNCTVESRFYKGTKDIHRLQGKQNFAQNSKKKFIIMIEKSIKPAVKETPKNQKKTKINSHAFQLEYTDEQGETLILEFGPNYQDALENFCNEHSIKFI